jgi:hypothetical protein
MPTNTYVELRTTIVSSATSSVTFDLTGITGYTDIHLVSQFGNTAAGNQVGVRFNGDTGNNYSVTQLNGPMPFGGSWRQVNASQSNVWGSPIVVGVTNSLTNFGSISFQNYSNSTTNKTMLARYGYATGEVVASVGLWRNTAAITSISLVATGGTTFLAGSTFSLYGIAAMSALSPTAKATGGTITTDQFGYVYHAFTSTGTFTPSQALSCDAMVLAGGGGGGKESGGGGGAGGLLSLTSQSFAATGYLVTVGGGGAGSSTTSRGASGIDSSIAGFTSAVGGGGGGSQGGTATGATGGSGGGGTYLGQAGGASTVAQGFAGGNGSNDAGAGGGGGGAGAPGNNGQTGSPYASGSGGAGSNAYASWALVTSTGASGYYGGGGGGGNNSSSNAVGAGGIGGGGTGRRDNTTGSAGTTNTGGGGGGGGSTNGGYSGGSGIVIIRYYGA